MKCPKCDKKLNRRRGVHFDHELICHDCWEAHTPEEWKKRGALDDEQLKLLDASAKVKVLEGKVHELTAERNELLKFVRSIAVTVNVLYSKGC
tara:strand:- start:895 stop:1173 length:279 start_codon:yes stop_codon:yes gene_type:complete